MIAKSRPAYTCLSAKTEKDSIDTTLVTRKGIHVGDDNDDDGPRKLWRVPEWCRNFARFSLILTSSVLPEWNRAVFLCCNTRITWLNVGLPHKTAENYLKTVAWNCICTRIADVFRLVFHSSALWWQAKLQSMPLSELSGCRLTSQTVGGC